MLYKQIYLVFSCVQYKQGGTIMLLCGMYEMDITPTLGASIPGQMLDKKSTGILDNLYAKSLIIDNGSTVFAILSIDICAIMASQVCEIRKGIRQKTGISVRNILVAATHTHTGGPCELWARLYKPDDEYLRFVVQKVVDCAVLAFHGRRLALIGFGLGSEQRLSFHRRYRMKDGSIRTNPGVGNKDIVEPDGPIDPDVAVMRIDDASGSPMGVLTNFSCHLDCVGGTQISGDYPGELSKIIKEKLGRSVVSLFLTGACGNINHINFLSEDPIRQQHWKWMGALLAEDVLRVREHIQTTRDFSIQIETTSIHETRREPTEAELSFMENTLAKSKAELSEVDWWKAMQIFLISTDRCWSSPLEIELQAVRFGDMSVIAIPNELFVEYSMEIKQRSPFKNNMVSTLTNGLHGYVPTPSAFKAGGYESTLAYSSCLHADTGGKIVNAVCILLDKLSKNESA